MKQELSQMGNRFILEACKVTIYQCQQCPFFARIGEEMLFLAHYKTHYAARRPPTILTEQNCDSLLDLDSGESDLDEHCDDGKSHLSCIFCSEEFQHLENVRSHLMEEHGCVPFESSFCKDLTSVVTDVTLTETVTAAVDKAPAIPDRMVCSSPKQANEILVKKSSEANEEWLKPVSLKDLKRKLRRTFTFKCSYKACLYSFESKKNQISHERCHVSTTPENVKAFRCFECQTELTNWRLCSSHMWNVHQIDIDLLKCPICNYKAGLSVQMFRHLQSHSPTKGFACSECPQTFKLFSQLRVHGITHIVKATAGPHMRWYSQKKCDICGNVFSNSKILSKHIKAVHNKIKPFICNVCGHKSARKSSWLIHIRQHTGEKPFSCKECNFRAADPSVIRKHEMRHHKTDGVPYNCPDCSYASIQSASLKTHLRKYHPNSYHSVVCDQCNFVSVSAEIMKRHKRIHLYMCSTGTNEAVDESFKDPEPQRTRTSEKPNGHIEISSDCFLPIESDSLAHEPPLDRGGFTIPAHSHSEESQFPNFS